MSQANFRIAPLARPFSVIQLRIRNGSSCVGFWDMALHCDADMVRAIVGACQVKFLSGPAGRQGQDALA